MAVLSQFSASEAELLISLPYRVGVFVSYADDLEGERDDEYETKALVSALKSVAVLHESTPLIAEIFKETIRLKFEWRRWNDRAFTVVADAKVAISLLRSKGDLALVRAYRAALMQVAGAVARAHSEFEQFDEGDKNSDAFGGLVSKIIERFSGFSEEDADHPMNISAAEGGALAELSEALKG